LIFEITIKPYTKVIKLTKNFNMNKERDYDKLFKMITIGDSSVGKSALMIRKVDDTFNNLFISTIGVDFRYCTVIVNDKRCKLQIWDTAGQERYRTITSSYYRGADGVIIVYDITNLTSFAHISNWMAECDKYNPKMMKILVGNKCDIDRREISSEEGDRLAKKYNMHFIETSAKTGHNVYEAFEQITKDMMSKSLPYNVDDNKTRITPIETKPSPCSC